MRHSILAAAAALAIAAPATATPPAPASVDLQARPAAAIADLRGAGRPVVAPLPPAIKLEVLRKGGVVVRDLPVGPPHVTVAKPVDQGLSLSYYNIFGADAGIDYAQFKDRQGFIGLNWRGVPGAIYLVDCEVPGTSSSSAVEVIADGSQWTPVTISAGHIVFAVPALPDVPGYNGHAFAMRSTGAGFHGCEVSKVK